MNLAALYPWIKAIHVAAALIFVGGMFAVSVLLAALRAVPGDAKAIARFIRGWDSSVTTPSLLLVWALGFALASAGHWFGDAWLAVKLGIVILLSAIHGVQSGRLRRLAAGAAIRSWRVTPLILASAFAIAILAVAKPFG